MISQTTDRRNAERVPFLCEVECKDFGLGRLRISDLSTTGAFIDTLTYVRIGSILRLQFSVGGVNVTVMAEVRHCVPQIGIGVQFLDLGVNDKNRIDLVLNELHTQQAA